MSISLCIVINQWHPKLPETLNSYKDCCSEILLGINGDFYPQDYPELEQNKLLKIFPLKWQGYGKTKNELAGYAENDWILSVDADEAADSALQKALREIKPDNPQKVYALSRCQYFGEKSIKYGAWKAGSKKYIRMYNRNFTKWNNAAVHEEIIVPESAEIVTLRGNLKHYTVEDYRQLIEKHKLYAQLSAEKYATVGKATFFGKSWLSAGFNFLQNYFFRLGFLDGKAGWQIAKGTTLYTFWKYDLFRKMKKNAK